MVRIIPNGKLPRPWLAILLLTLATSATYAQTQPTRCTVTSVPTQVRAEGLTERMGDIVLQCTGNPGAVLTGNLSLFFPVSVTNRVDASNLAQDAAFSVDSGLGFVPTATRGLVSGNNLSFNGLSITVPATGNFNLKISNVRGAMTQQNAATVFANLSFFIPINQSQVAVAFSQKGLYSVSGNTSITCVGSSLPSAIDFADLLSNGTAFQS